MKVRKLELQVRFTPISLSDVVPMADTTSCELRDLAGYNNFYHNGNLLRGE